MATDDSDDEFQKISDVNHAKISQKMEKVSKMFVCTLVGLQETESCQRNRIGGVSIGDIAIWLKLKHCEK